MRLIVCIVFIVFLSQCGVKSPPLPPLEKSVTKQDTPKKKQTPKKDVKKVSS